MEDVAFELCPEWCDGRFKGQDRITEVLNVLLQSWDWICRWWGARHYLMSSRMIVDVELEGGVGRMTLL